MNLGIDIETFSDVDLPKSGVYKYAESPNFEILLFGYSVDGGEAKVVDLAQGEKIPDDILRALSDESVTKWGYNCSFERTCLSKYLGKPLSPKGWKCSMVWSAYLGLPLSLKAVAEVLELSEQKMDEGKALIKYFSMPCKPTKANDGRTRNLPMHDREKWETFKAYNKRDVEVETAIRKRFSNFPVPEFVWDEYWLDQSINDRGVLVDMELVNSAITIDGRSREELSDAMCEITNLDNPNSVQQLRQWLLDNGLEMDSLGKKEVVQALKAAPEPLRTVLTLRQQIARSSVKKYQAMKTSACDDNRCRGMFQFYGANRTGREAGRIVQLQNLAKNHMPDLNRARELVKSGDYELLSMLYDDIPDTLSQLIRTAFIPKKGKKFIVADFSAIEARVIAWLAGERWVLDTFKNGGDIYCETASRMFHVPVEKHGQNADLRQKGKQAVLSCSYGGSIGALKMMGAIEAGMAEEELKPLVDSWRAANPNIVQFWWDVDLAVTEAVTHKRMSRSHGLTFSCKSGMLFITLPSGRNLAYIKPKIGVNRFGGHCVTYEGVGATKRWERIDSYGPKFAENIVQAIARDILFYAMKSLSNYDIVMTIHDEVVIEADSDMSVEDVCSLMSQTPPWAVGLPLAADGYECEYYRKD